MLARNGQQFFIGWCFYVFNMLILKEVIPKIGGGK